MFCSDTRIRIATKRFEVFAKQVDQIESKSGPHKGLGPCKAQKLALTGCMQQV